ncbi:hypothetical protein HYV84_07275 [Candidatus Woesearchaeota archaeon]|nr:hypothetical protein [Candidatus Woesearchaeota archaeon]
MKLSKLRGIANNAVQPGAWSFPFSSVKPPYAIEVNLVTGRITPEPQGDDVEAHYKKVIAWFHESLKREGIPLSVIEKAVIHLRRETSPACTIIARGKTFSSKE